jgi:hypothetical protein
MTNCAYHIVGHVDAIGGIVIETFSIKKNRSLSSDREDKAGNRLIRRTEKHRVNPGQLNESAAQELRRCWLSYQTRSDAEMALSRATDNNNCIN